MDVCLNHLQEVDLQVVSRKEVEESRANRCRKLSTMWGAGVVPRAAIFENALKILEDS